MGNQGYQVMESPLFSPGFAGSFHLGHPEEQATYHCRLETIRGAPRCTWSTRDGQDFGIAGHQVAATGGDNNEHEPDIIAAFTGRAHWAEESMAAIAEGEGSANALAATYRKYGSEIGKQITGHYAGAIIDRGQRRVLLLTDRMGSVPLYYRQNADTITFGTSAHFVNLLSGSDCSLDPQALYDYVYFHMVPAPGTIHRHLYKAQPATLVSLNGTTATSTRYWLPSFREASSNSKSEMHLSLRKHLRNSVLAALPMAAKTGAFLSGGLDSSTVAGMLSELRPGDCDAYAIGFDAKGYDEMAYARITAKHFGIKLHEYYVTPEDVMDALPLVATCYDEPFGNSSALPAYFCAKMASEQGVHTLLAGDGGDELFAGNERYAKQKVFEAYQAIPASLRRSLVEPSAQFIPGRIGRKARNYIKQANTPLPARMQTYNFLHQNIPADIFTTEFFKLINPCAPELLLSDIYHAPERASSLNRMLYLDWQITLADNDLRKVSQACATAGVEAVFPLLDDRLVEFSTALPSDWKLPGNKLRHFYKQALRGWLPDATIKKAKHGFGLPFGVWMKTHKPLQEMAYHNLLKLKQRDIIRPAFIDQLIEDHRHGHSAYYGELIWVLMTLELWITHQDASP